MSGTSPLFLEKKVETAAAVLEKTIAPFSFVIVAGTGLGSLEKLIERPLRIPYSEIPYFVKPSIEGHRGTLIQGRVGEKCVVVLSGRHHLYEGASVGEICFPYSVLARLKMKYLILTNAAGGINPELSAGDVMLIEDQINLQGKSITPDMLISYGENSIAKQVLKSRRIYDPEMKRIVRKTAVSLGISLKEGVYCGVLGPSYETDAEVEMIRLIGADAVGMSTVLESAYARFLDIKVLGMSLITNVRRPGRPQITSHEEILSAAEKSGDTFVEFLKVCMGEL